MNGTYVWKKYFSLLFFFVCVSAAINPAAVGSIIYDQSPIQNNPCGNDWWPMFRHDIAHGGFSTTTAPEDNQVLWSYQTNDAISSSPAVSHGKVYVGSWDWNIYCFDMDSGNLIWNYSTNGQITSSPAVVNGKVYVGSQDSRLYCLNAINGTYLWDFQTDFIVETSPIVIDESVFFGSSDGSLYCLNVDDGSLLWNYQTGSVIVSSPAVKDGKVYFGATNGNLLCLDSTDGSFLWKYTMTDGVYSSPALDDGKIYFGSNDKNVYCLDAGNGSLIWNYSASGEVHSSPALAYDFLYIGTSDGQLLCLQKATGDFIWNYQISGSITSPPSVADGKVYFGTDPCCGFLSYFICLNAFDGTKIWEYNFNTQLGMKSSPALAASKVFAGSGDGKVYAFGDIEFLADANGPYHGIIDNPVHFTGSVYGGQPGFSWYWDFGDDTTSTDRNPTHTYTALGEYTVTLTVTDNTGDTATDDTSVSIELPNASPEKPVVDGPSTGKPGESYDYSFSSSDPNSDTIRYFIDWGDDTTSGWIGPFQSGLEIKKEHAWSEKDSYIIKAKAKDSHGAESIWSDPFEITITAPELEIEIRGGFGVRLTITNAGDAAATNVHWNITFDSGFVIPSYRIPIYPTIAPGGKITEKMLVFGFGKTTIDVTATCDEGISVKKTAHATLVLFFVFWVK
jgi:outer membrane protein assembly factor BamB